MLGEWQQIELILQAKSMGRISVYKIEKVGLVFYTLPYTLPYTKETSTSLLLLKKRVSVYFFYFSQ